MTREIATFWELTEGQGFRRNGLTVSHQAEDGTGDRGEMASACSTPADELLL